MRYAIALLFACSCFAQECTVGVLEWRDAVLSTRSTDVDAAKTARIVTFGCVITKEKEYVVIMSITADVPDVFITVPKDWAVKLTPLKVSEPEKTEAKEVPK